MRHSTVQTLKPGPTLIEQAYEAILEAICAGRLAAGERLNQDALAARLGISRQPVGQALSVLKAQGFVRDTGRRGLIVAPLEREFLRAIYELREALDSLAASLAAQRCQPGDAAEGRKLLAEGRRAARSGRVDAQIEADMRFHLWICQVAGNPLLSDTMRLYWSHLRRAMSEVATARRMVRSKAQEDNARTAVQAAHYKPDDSLPSDLSSPITQMQPASFATAPRKIVRTNMDIPVRVRDHHPTGLQFLAIEAKVRSRRCQFSVGGEVRASHASDGVPFFVQSSAVRTLRWR